MLMLDILLIFMIVGTIIAIETSDLLSTVIAISAVGFGLSIVFLLLGAPDLAIIQVVVEILVLIILLRAIVTREDTSLKKPLGMLGSFPVASVLIFCGIFLTVAFLVFRDLPPFGEPVMKVAGRYLEEGFRATGAGNLVTAVLLDFRAYDTLGEATVIFAAVVGVYVVLRKVGRKRK